MSAQQVVLGSNINVGDILVMGPLKSARYVVLGYEPSRTWASWSAGVNLHAGFEYDHSQAILTVADSDGDRFTFLIRYDDMYDVIPS